ncbi:hypothetical protein AWZ03_002519 [Drosophila navojoa]|uniref:ZP domain-containing protein n=1 Tax=Drosophila navojoa TaxID=7232 RepID=A0A484BQP9_DRONA|nr:uncharacterized protein LOC108654525 [Drosophila navojoa]TDG51156.1 hypothetical protein AWZ03_002519 [Drosophila navojoa]
MSTNWTRLLVVSPALRLLLLLLLLLLLDNACADVAHFFAAPAEFGSYLHGQAPFQLALPQYGPPAASPVTPAPVAPVAPSTTEFILPEIIDNRSLVKSFGPAHGNFIPLSQHYLPPSNEERPSYESPKPSDEFAGYYYPQPSGSSTTRIPSTTTTTPRPIVVQELGEDGDEEQLAAAGYDYHAPPKRPSTPAPVYLPPGESGVQHQQQNQLRLRIKDMRCLQAGYFRAILKLDSFVGAAPVLDNDYDESSADKHCELKLSRSYLLLDIAGADFERCGVRNCGQDLCLRLRFPAIRGLRTGGDSILTLHCKTQERVAVKTHALKMGVANDVQARSAGSYAHGGNQNAFRTHVELLRRGSNGYTQHLESNGAVQLGEELLLRAHVLAGDGWNYTKLSDVQLQRISAGGEVLNSVQLITPRGCLNPAMQSICAHAPSAEPPLGQRLQFRAVMFPGMHSGDVLVMSMRITGCLEREDCQLSAQDCQPGVAQRRRRDTVLQPHANGTEASELSHITFRVIMPHMELPEQPAIVTDLDSSNVTNSAKSFALFGSVGFVVLLLGVAVVALYKLGK